MASCRLAPAESTSELGRLDLHPQTARLSSTCLQGIL